jgi:hypothetical protein
MLLGPLRRLTEFAALGPRLTDQNPLDSWQEDGLHYFVFPLGLVEVDSQAGEDAEAPVAVFVIHSASRDLIAAVAVTPRSGGDGADVQDLRSPDSADENLAS